jgi:2-keto-4-pentenoate hydratase
MTAIDTQSDSYIAEISDKLFEARKTSTGLPGFPGALPETLEAAYKIQDRIISKIDDEIIGWKIGGITPDLQEKLNAVRLCGPIFKKMVKYTDGSKPLLMPVFKDGYSAYEVEYIMELGDTSHLPATGITEEQIRSVIKRVFIGFEMASSPIQDVNKVGSMAVISDLGINEGCIIGPEIKDWKNVDLFGIDISINIDGKLFGPTKAKPGFVGAYGAVKFLIEHMKANGKTLPVGTMASTGAITGVHDINVGVGSKADVKFAGLGGFSMELVSNG